MTTQQNEAINRLSVWAVRYAIGRATYAVQDVVDTLITQHDALDENSKRVIVKDIDKAFASEESAGWEADRAAWLRLRDFLLADLAETEGAAQ